MILLRADHSLPVRLLLLFWNGILKGMVKMALKKMTNEEFIKKIYDLVGNEYEFLEEYKGSNIKIKVKHTKCNHHYSVSPNKFTNQGRRCPKCNGGMEITESMFLEIIKEQRGNEYILLSEFNGFKNKITIKHNICGHEWNVNANYFIKENQVCPECKKQKSYENKTKVFKEKIYELVGNEYEVIGKYTYLDAPIELFHIKCGNTYSVRPSHFIDRNHRCPFCSKNRRKTSEQFINEVYVKYNEEYEVIGDYHNDRTEIKIRHNTCGYEFSVPPREFLDKSQCPVCSKNCQRINTEIFELKMQKILGEEYITVNEYVDSRTKIKIKHTICNQNFEATPNHVLSRKTTRCPNCFGGKRITHIDFLEIIKDVHGNEYEVLSIYKNSDTPIEVRHTVCNYIFNPIPYGFMRGSGCPRCAGVLNLTHEEFISRMEQFGKINEFEFLETYTSMNTKIRTKHKPCGRIYDANPAVLLRGSGCIKCKESSGERNISEYLSKNEIKYNTQYRFDDCRNKNTLPFDFAIFTDENNLVFLIEYDGEQHFHPIEYFGGEENLNYVQHNDSIKNEYCKIKNIRLIRIPYWDFHKIEEILHNDLIENNLIYN